MEMILTRKTAPIAPSGHDAAAHVKSVQSIPTPTGLQQADFKEMQLPKHKRSAIRLTHLVHAVDRWWLVLWLISLKH